ncbi:MAG: alanyl-tRNA editing protein [Oscillospiraceae bacterium]|nr:alanyl-tRNA editing protein [Oscillospiraceae bacterium]
MNKASQLYLTDSYLRRFTAQVLTCEKRPGGYAVTLDRTAFYPEGGGQPADRGILENAEVLDVQMQGDTVLHLLDRPLTPGDSVTGAIDWARRLDHMQQHTAEHIVSGIVHQLYGYDNIGFRLPVLGQGFVSVDFSGVLDEGMLRETESRANALVASDVELGVAFPSSADLSQLDYRSKKELDGPVRLILIPGADLCACCGTHVNRSGEVQLIKILSHEKNHGGTRLFLAAGWRALHDYAEKHDGTAELSALLKTPPKGVPAAVRRLYDENAALCGRLHLLEGELFALLAQSAPAHAPSLRRDGLSPDGCRRLCLLLKERCTGVCRVFSKKEDGGFLYALASRDADVRPFAKALNEACGGRGGGRPELCTGTLKKLPPEPGL